MLADLVDRMMSAVPTLRPTIGEVHAALMGIRTGDPATAPAPSGALRGKLVGAAPRASAPEAPAAATTSALKGTLISRPPREGRS